MSDVLAPEPVTESSGRRRMIRVFLALVPAIAFIGLLWFGLGKSGSKAVTGEKGPSFELPLLGRSGTLTDEDLRGKAVVVNFWASWCIPCREEAPLLERTWRSYRDDGVVFLGVNIKDAEPDAIDFMEKYDITYPVVRDLEEELVRGFGVKGLPETFFIDDKWTFIGTASGPRSEAQQGTVVLGAISEDELVENVEILIRRASTGS